MTKLSPNRLKPTLHPAYARLICAYFVRQGFEIEEILEGTNLEWDTLIKDSSFLCFEQLARLAQKAVDLTHKPWIGLEIGMSIQTGHHGSLGYGAVVSPSVLETVKFVVNYMSTRQRIFDVEYQVDGEGVALEFNFLVDMETDIEFVACAVIGLVFRIAVTITGKSIEGGRIHLPFDAPEWAEQFNRQIPANEFIFSQNKLMIQIPAEYLHLICLTHEDSAFQMAKAECERIKAAQDRGQDVLQQVRSRLLDGQGSFLSQEEIAEQMNVSPRTLMRKLKAEGSSYQELLDDVRKEYAIWYLTKTDMTVDEVSESLGYIDASNFARTFKRWVGTTPSLFRRKSE